MIQIASYIIFTVLILLIVKKYLDKKGHPKALFYLFFAEMWERFSFYGMRALLVLYLIKDYYSQLENNEVIAYGIYASYGALVYLTPLIGGYLADKFIGYRKSIIFGGILMALGHFCMAFQNDIFFYGALGLLIIGNGFFKPNISTLVGSLYPEGDPRRDSGFTIFYMGINLGAMIAPLFCGFLGETYGWHYGFAAAGVGMLAGLIVFWKGIKNGVLGDKGLQPSSYIGKKISGITVEKIVYIFGFLCVPVFAYLILLDTQSKILGSVLLVVLAVVLSYLFYIIYDLKIKQKNNVEGDRLIAILILSLFLTVFWACFEIAGSAITVWADKCVNLLGLTATQTNAINPFYIVLLAIPFSWLWTKLDLSKRNPNTPVKFGLGLLQLGLGFLVFAFSIFYIGENGKVPVLFLFLGYLFITTGELFLSPIGLSKVTQLAPKKIISFIMGVWFLSSTFAHYISGGIAELTTVKFYNETSIITVSKEGSQNKYVFDMSFDFNNNVRNIKKIETYDKENETYVLRLQEFDNEKDKYVNIDLKEKTKKFIVMELSKFKELNLINTKKLSKDSLINILNQNIKSEKEQINALIINEIIQSENKFWWDVNSKGLLILTLKSEKENHLLSEQNEEKVKNILKDFKSKTKNTELTSSLITTFYKTNESINGNSDAIAGLSYSSNNIVNSSWNDGFNKSNLSPVPLNINLTSDEGISVNYNFSIQEGPSDLLSVYTNKLLGSPKIKNKPIATLMQYNIVYMKIGIVTILISILVMLLSPFIRKLMHGVH